MTKILGKSMTILGSYFLLPYHLALLNCGMTVSEHPAHLWTHFLATQPNWWCLIWSPQKLCAACNFVQ
jgi:hypothetical protein